MIQFEWFMYGVAFGYFLNPLITIIKAVVREAKTAKSEWRKDGRD